MPNNLIHIHWQSLMAVNKLEIESELKTLNIPTIMSTEVVEFRLVSQTLILSLFYFVLAYWVATVPGSLTIIKMLFHNLHGCNDSN